MKNFWIILLLFGPNSFAKLAVVATTSDVGALIREVAADKVDLFVIGKGSQDPHQIEAKPSFMVKMRDADLIFSQGLELEVAWLDPLIQGSRNPKLKDKQNVVELGKSLDPIEVRAGGVSRAEGDIHPEGNPHFQLDPVRMAKAAGLVADELAARDAANKSFFVQRAKEFKAKIDKQVESWRARVKKSKLKEVVTFHRTFTYFCSRFDLTCDTQLEPKPGIPPTAAHLLTVIDHIKKENIRLVLIESYFEDSAKDKLMSSVPNLMVVRVPVSVDGDKNVASYTDLIENLVKIIEGVGL